MKGSKVTTKSQNKTTSSTNPKLNPKPSKTSHKEDDRITVDSTSTFINEPMSEWPQWCIDLIEPEVKPKINKIIPKKGKI